MVEDDPEPPGHNTYFYSYILVVHSPFVAWIVSYTGNFKWIAYTGVPIIILHAALLIPFWTPSTSLGVLALTQVVVGIGSGIFATCAQLAVMVLIKHQEIAAITALWGLFGSFGSSIGVAIPGAMWNNLLPRELYNRLPEASKANATLIFGDIETQIAFLNGTPERDTIVGAYSYVMRNMVIAGVALVPLCLASIFIWKNINIKKLEEERGKQTKGTVF